MEQTMKLPAVKPATNKSTTVRSFIREASIRHGLAALAGLSPALAAQAAERMFLTPRRFPRPAWEQVALRTAQRSTLTTALGALPVYSWGSGPTVLLVHGWEGRGSQLSGFVPALVSAGYRALAVDMPGHGEAAPALSSAVDFARALSALLPQIEDLRGVIAHSMGGAATTLSYLFAPYQARLVLLAPPRGPRGFFDMFTSHLALSEPTRAALELRMQRRFGRTIDEIDIAATGAHVKLDALVIHDRGDKEVPFAHGQLYVRTLPSSQLMATEGLGHRRILRDAGVIEAAVTFLAHEPVTGGMQEDCQYPLRAEQA